MKTKKIIFGLLPLFLVLGACSNSTNNSQQSQKSEQPASSEQSSEEQPQSSSSEKPVVPPEVREQQAREEFARIKALADGGNYTVNMIGSFAHDAKYYVAEDFYFQNLYFNEGYYSNMKYEGWSAKSDGVIGYSREYSDAPMKTAGYVKKTASLEESLAFVNSKKRAVTISDEGWTYVGNDGTTTIFVNTSEEAYQMYANLDNIEYVPNYYDGLYLKIYNGKDEFRLNPIIKDNELQFSSALVKDFGQVLELSDMKVAYQRAAAWESAEWHETIDGNGPLDELVFPASGSKFYFVDNVTYDWDSETDTPYYYNLRIGFIDTGDIRTQYIQQLLDNDYVLDPREDDGRDHYVKLLNNPRESERDKQDWESFEAHSITLEYREPSENYPQGIFYINRDRTTMNRRSGTGWADWERNMCPSVEYVPFPSEGANRFYQFWGGEENATAQFYYLQDTNAFVANYEQQLAAAGFVLYNGYWINEDHVYNHSYNEDEYLDIYELLAVYIYNYPESNSVAFNIQRNYNVEIRDNTRREYTPKEINDCLFYAKNLPFLTAGDPRNYGVYGYYGSFTVDFYEAGDQVAAYGEQLVTAGYTLTQINEADAYVLNLKDYINDDPYGVIEDTEIDENEGTVTDTYMVIQLGKFMDGDNIGFEIRGQVMRLTFPL